MRKSKYTKEILEEAVSKSKSFSGVLDFFNLKKTGGNYRNIQSHIKINNIDTSHFTGQSWSKGLTKEDHPSIKSISSKQRYDISYLRKNISLTTKVTKRLLLESGLQYMCENGHLPEWMGEPMTLHIDHIDGDKTNNTLENLRFLCPNCHQQTLTWGNKSKK